MIIIFKPENKTAISGTKLDSSRSLRTTILNPIIFMPLLIMVLYLNLSAEEQDEQFNFSKYLTGPLQTLSVQIQNVDYTTGQVTVGGYDSRCPTIAFTWDWGDEAVSNGFFPQSHTYSDLTKNYTVTVTAHYSETDTDTQQAILFFVPPTIMPVSLSEDIAVSVPDSNITMKSRIYSPPSTLTYFDESYFTIIPRSTVEYILTVGASIQIDFVNNDVYLASGDFKQVLLRYPGFGGMCSLWFTNPVSFGVGDYGFQGSYQWSSFFHEMGHNATLNSPADYYYGGKIDGPANMIFSETMAQIFQHATAYEIINNANEYGIGSDLITDIKNSAISSMLIVRNAYEEYLSSGMNYTSWNDPDMDLANKTFMTIAYKFFEHAEDSDIGYRIPLKRMMKFLQNFNQDIRDGYDQANNNISADAYRATLMVSALSYAFSADLRTEFEDLNFLIDYDTYDELMNLVTSIDDSGGRLPLDFILKQNYPNPFNPVTTIEFTIPTSQKGHLAIFNLRGQLIESAQFNEGYHRFFWNGAKYSSGIYFYKLSSDKYSEIRKMLMIW